MFKETLDKNYNDPVEQVFLPVVFKLGFKTKKYFKEFNEDHQAIVVIDTSNSTDILQHFSRLFAHCYVQPNL